MSHDNEPTFVPLARVIASARVQARAQVEGLAGLYADRGAAGLPAIPVRPQERGECFTGENAARPCPWVSCEYHALLDVDLETGELRRNADPALPFERLAYSCVLDAADQGGLTLEETGELLRVTRERVRQIESKALAKVSRKKDLRALREDFEREVTRPALAADTTCIGIGPAEMREAAERAKKRSAPADPGRSLTPEERRQRVAELASRPEAPAAFVHPWQRETIPGIEGATYAAPIPEARTPRAARTKAPWSPKKRGGGIVLPAGRPPKGAPRRPPTEPLPEPVAPAVDPPVPTTAPSPPPAASVHTHYADEGTAREARRVWERWKAHVGSGRYASELLGIDRNAPARWQQGARMSEAMASALLAQKSRPMPPAARRGHGMPPIEREKVGEAVARARAWTDALGSINAAAMRCEIPYVTFAQGLKLARFSPKNVAKIMAQGVPDERVAPEGHASRWQRADAATFARARVVLERWVTHCRTHVEVARQLGVSRGAVAQALAPNGFLLLDVATRVLEYEALPLPAFAPSVPSGRWTPAAHDDAARALSVLARWVAYGGSRRRAGALLDLPAAPLDRALQTGAMTAHFAKQVLAHEATPLPPAIRTSATRAPVEREREQQALATMRSWVDATGSVSAAARAFGMPGATLSAALSRGTFSAAMVALVLAKGAPPAAARPDDAEAAVRRTIAGLGPRFQLALDEHEGRVRVRLLQGERVVFEAKGADRAAAFRALAGPLARALALLQGPGAPRG